MADDSSNQEPQQQLSAPAPTQSDSSSATCCGRYMAHRKTQYAMILEGLPWWAFLIFFGCFFAIVFLVILFSALFAPKPLMLLEHKSNFVAISNTTYQLQGETSALSQLNQELTTYLQLHNKLYVPPENRTEDDQSFGFIKGDLKLQITVEGRRDSKADWQIISQTTTPLVRTLVNELCSSLTVSYLNHIGFTYFRFSVTMDNTDMLLQNNLITPTATFRFETYSDDYSKFSIGWRYALLIITVPFTIAAVSFMLIRQDCRNWHGEQFWVLILSIVMIFYNNPLYMFIYLIPGWIFPFINIVFIASFFCYLMFTVLVLTHAVVKRREERTFVWFYLPKFILIGAIWLFVIIVFTYVRLQEKENPTFDFAQDNSTAYITLAIIAVAIILAYLFIVGFYLFRAIGLACQKKLPSRYSARFKVVWIFTVLVLIATIVDVLLYVFSRVWNNAAQFLSYFIIYNLYTVMMTLFYLPTLRVTDSQKMAQEEREIIMEEDHLYDEENHHLNDDA